MAQIQQVAAPRRKPRVGGIRSIVGDFVLEPRLSAVTGVKWESLNCSPEANQTRAGCYSTVPSEDKVTDGVAFLESIEEPFALYRGVECWIGGDQEGPSWSQQAADALAESEERSIERFLGFWARGGTQTPVANLAAAIAEADLRADTYYVGLPLIMLSRSDAVRAHAAQAILREDGGLITPNGTPVLATTGQWTGYVSVIGRPEIYASPVISAGAHKLRENVEMAIAERVYAIGIDCEFRQTYTTSP